VAHGSTRRPRRGKRAPAGRDVDRINKIANGLTEASLALTAEDPESARRAVDETLALATSYLSEVVAQGEARARRRRRSWSSGVASAAAVAAGIAFAGPAVLDSLAPGRGDQELAQPRPPAAGPGRPAVQPDTERLPDIVAVVPPPPPVLTDESDTAPPPPVATHPSLLVSTSGKPAERAQLNWARHADRPGRGAPAGGLGT
jgi:hypothetical protein